ncbi:MULTISPECIES: carbon storage regulator CsrA [Paenibacillus]|uniref:Translational regulator CsrA n=2 Tax=Paenibacillus TaxID=44249 RepID=A0ABT4E4H7_PAEAL|nr:MULTISPECIES: carbon storage regulator CsrA [Paenibacillus]MCY9528646.1 carbon storage regulator CsrA [Paenibacillus alvei]TQR43738.1 carbon storage regulator [Paenibacillus sp. SDF0028]SDG23624.1 carbon storage regulator, CsrA [Paenibacillus sp. cl6col]
MLVLTRKKGQSIVLNNDIEIQIVSVDGEQIKIGISAPKDVVILRKELVEEIKATNQEAVAHYVDIDMLKKIKK